MGAQRPSVRWCRVPAVDTSVVDKLRRRFQGVDGLDGLARLGGLDTRLTARGLEVCSGRSPKLIEVRRLTTENGQVRSKAREVLGGLENPVITPEAFRDNVAEEQGPSTSDAKLLQLNALVLDEIDILHQLAKHAPGSVMYVIKALPEMMYRMSWWRQVRALGEGADPDTLTPSQTHTTAAGLVEVQPAALAVFPLIARAWPMAMAWMLRRGQQVVQVVDTGFARPPTPGVWPTPAPLISGSSPSAIALYKRSAAHLVGQAGLLLGEFADRASAALNHLTAPEVYVANGVLDVEEQQIHLGSFLLGVSALTEAATDYNSHLAEWSCLRSLDILRGMWSTSLHATPAFAEFLTPRRIRRYAVEIIDAPYGRWADGVLRAYEEELRRVFGQDQRAPKHLAEMRNALHGFRGPDDTSRRRRLDAIDKIIGGAFPTVLLSDLAVIWWTATLYSPQTLLMPGDTPW